MKLSKIFRTGGAALICGVGLFLAAGCSLAAEKTQSKHGLVLLDFVVMNSKFGDKERDAYEREVAPIAARYGMKMIQSYKLEKFLNGSIPKNTARLNLWDVPSPETLKKLSQDQDYQALIPHRNKIHAMQNVTLFFAEPVLDPGQLKSHWVLVDLVVLNEGYALKDREAYTSTVGGIAADYGMVRASSFRVTKQLAGPKQEAVELNLWTLPSPESMGKLSKDARYQAQIAERNKIHNMSKLSMFLAKPIL